MRKIMKFILLSTEWEFFNLIHEQKKKPRWEIYDDENTNVSHTAMYSNIEMLPSPLRSAFSKISERAENLYFFLKKTLTSCTLQHFILCTLRSLLTFLVSFVSEIPGNNRNHFANRASLLHFFTSFDFYFIKIKSKT